MTGAGFWLWFLIPWAAIGVTTGIVMGRRGHHGLSWAVLGVAFGPMLIPAAVAARDESRRHPTSQLAPGRPGSGAIDVLVGVDGSPAAREAVRDVVSLLGDHLGRLTLAIVVDHDTAWNTDGVDHRRAVERLEEAAELAPAGLRPELLVLSGPPAAALVEHAAACGTDLLVVGTRGAGLTKALLGSVAEDLARRTAVPVLLVPGTTAPATTVPDPAHAEA